MNTPFAIGDKVVCIRAGISRLQQAWKIRRLTKDKVYVIRALAIAPEAPHLIVYLVGITNPIHPTYKIEWAYNSNRFRKLDDMKAETAWANRIIEQLEKRL